MQANNSDNIASNIDILVIDDEYMSNVISEKLIKKVKKDSKIVVYQDGEKAIKKLIEIKNNDVNLLPGYIFLDIFMPKMSGWDFLEKFRSLNIDPFGKCKIYILTVSLFPEDIIRSTSYNIINDYLIKPLDFEKLKKIFE